MRKFIKWTGYGLAGVFLLLLILVGSLYFIGSAKINQLHQAQVATLIIPEDSASISRGAHLTKIFGCPDCHGPDLSGGVMIDEPPFRITAANLTPAGIGGQYTYAELDGAIRHGVRPDGRGLAIMPSSVFNNMADDDVAAIIAYLRTLEPVETDHPPTEIRTLGRLLAAGLIDPAEEVRTNPARSGAAPPVAPTVEYGEYLSSVVCTHCHGGDLRGREKPPAPGSPPAPDLAAAGAWPLSMFKETLRTGVAPNGRQMDAAFMPWPVTAEMTDVELEALHAYLGTLAD